MAQVRWTQAARDDVDSIAEYIAQDSPRYARGVVEKITVLTKTLPQHPKAGRIVPEIQREDIRERFIYSYRIIYLDDPQGVLILAVIHGKRLLETEEDRILSDADSEALPDTSRQ